MTFANSGQLINVNLGPVPELDLTDRPLRQPEMRLQERTDGGRLLLSAPGGWPKQTTIYLDDCILTLVAATAGKGTWYTAVQLPNHLDSERLRASLSGDEILVEMPIGSEFQDEDTLRELMILPANRRTAV